MQETYLEKALAKLARQINGYDEASLSALWDKYAEKVSRFEPTREWEEAAVIFSLIQGMRFKNQLFNYNFAQTSRPAAGPVRPMAPVAPRACQDCDKEKPAAKAAGNKKGKLLQLRPEGGDESGS